MPPPKCDVSIIPCIVIQSERILTRIDPFHAVGEHVGAVLRVIGDTQTIGLLNSAVGVEVVPSVAGICDDRVGICQAQAQQDQKGCPREM